MSLCLCLVFHRCTQTAFGLAAVSDRLTIIGGTSTATTNITNVLLSYTESKLWSRWDKHFPAMPTARAFPGVATTATHLVVAGGCTSYLYTTGLNDVEVMDIEKKRWFTANSLRRPVCYPSMTLAGAHLYLLDDNRIVSCSMKELIHSCVKPPGNPSGASPPVWRRIPDLPVENGSILTSLLGYVLAIGGTESDGQRKDTIHCYDAANKVWCVVGVMPTPRSGVLAAVLPSSNTLIIAGGNTRCLMVQLISRH